MDEIRSQNKIDLMNLEEILGIVGGSGKNLVCRRMQKL
jgi:hypothetical protein